MFKMTTVYIYIYRYNMIKHIYIFAAVQSNSLTFTPQDRRPAGPQDPGRCHALLRAWRLRPSRHWHETQKSGNPWKSRHSYLAVWKIWALSRCQNLKNLASYPVQSNATKDAGPLESHEQRLCLKKQQHLRFQPCFLCKSRWPLPPVATSPLSSQFSTDEQCLY